MNVNVDQDQASPEAAGREPASPGTGPKERKAPMRRCVATRDRVEKPALFRLVLDPDRRPFIDLVGKAPGRAVYVRPDRALVEEALSPKGLGRAFKGGAITLSDEEIRAIVEDTLTRLERRLLELVSLAKRAGQLVIGMDSVESTLGAAPSVEGYVVVTARDLSERSAARVGDTRAPIVRAGTKAELGARLGRDETGVVAIRPSVFAERVKWEAERLEGLSSSSTNTASRGRVRSARKKEQD